jgi:hypothetical protein
MSAVSVLFCAPMTYSRPLFLSAQLNLTNGNDRLNPSSSMTRAVWTVGGLRIEALRARSPAPCQP